MWYSINVKGIDKMTLRDAIKNRREQLGLTQQDIARQLSTSDTTLSNIENGKTQKVPLDTAKKIADALNWDMIDLLMAINYLCPEDLQRHSLCQFQNCENLSANDQQYIQLFIDACARRTSNEVTL